tara:strand:+ start:512 stop:733 length:222 start_codon:yes stop_codon:yes gene_type:complete
MTTSFTEDLIRSLMQDCYGKIGMARMNIQVMLKNPTGVGDHSNYVQSIQEQAKIIAEAKGLLEVLDKEFYEKE